MFTPCCFIIEHFGKATCQRFLLVRLHMIGGVASCQTGAGVSSGRVGPRHLVPLVQRNQFHGRSTDFILSRRWLLEYL
jgi:hypothetical protein